jgi:hypothetical protein
MESIRFRRVERLSQVIALGLVAGNLDTNVETCPPTLHSAYVSGSALGAWLGLRKRRPRHTVLPIRNHDAPAQPGSSIEAHPKLDNRSSINAALRQVKMRGIHICERKRQRRGHRISLGFRPPGAPPDTAPTVRLAQSFLVQRLKAP